METYTATDLIIIGAGPVGLFTVFQAGMLGMTSCVIDALEKPGGQCAVLYPEKPIYDIPGYPTITAQELVYNLEEQAKPFKPIYLMSQIAQDISDDGEYFTVVTDKGNSVRGRVIVIAAGGGKFGPNRPPIESIEEYENKSVFYHVDKISSFSGKRILIAGGGDSAADWAVSLSEVASKVYMIHRRRSFRCVASTLSTLESLADAGKIDIMVPYQLVSFSGNDGVLESVMIRNMTSKEEISMEVDCVLPFFGISANLGPIANWGLGVEGFHIPINQSTCRTIRDRIYAIGDIASYQGKLKLILVGFSEAALACHDIYHVLFPSTPLNFQYSTSKGLPS